jgi:hypothetical protein
MITFDAAAREVCTSRRIRTNTPLQALVTLNDSVYLEASRHFAYRMQEQSKSNSVKDWISKGYRFTMLKPITKAKLDALENLYNKALVQFRNDRDKTCEMIGEMHAKHTNAETAALVVVANAMLNMDELITKN